MPLGKFTPEVVLDPSGHFVLVSSQAVDRVYIFHLNHVSGEFTPVPGSPFDIMGQAPFSIVLHPSECFLYPA